MMLFGTISGLAMHRMQVIVHLLMKVLTCILCSLVLAWLSGCQLLVIGVMAGYAIPEQHREQGRLNALQGTIELGGAIVDEGGGKLDGVTITAVATRYVPTAAGLGAYLPKATSECKRFVAA